MNISGGVSGQRIKSIQRGTFSTSTNGSGTVVIAPVNLNKSEVRSKAALRGDIHGGMTVCTHTEAQAGLMLRLANSSSLAWINAPIRSHEGVNPQSRDKTVYWEVVEYE